MRRVVITYLVDSGKKTPEGDNILTGMWAGEGKATVRGTDVQIFDANTGETLNGVIEVKLSISGPSGFKGSIKSIVMVKNPEAGKEITGPDGKPTKALPFMPLTDNRKNIAMTEEECIVVELAPMNEEIMKKLQGIRDVPAQLAQSMRDKMNKAAEEADLTKEEKK